MVRHLPVNREVPGSNPAAASFFCANKKEGNAAGRAGPWASSTTCSPPCPAGGTARHVIDIYSAQKEKNVSYNHKSACVPVVRLLPVHQGGAIFLQKKIKGGAGCWLTSTMGPGATCSPARPAGGTASPCHRGWDPKVGPHSHVLEVGPDGGTTTPCPRGATRAKQSMTI